MEITVPRLPEPNDHPPNDMYLPSTLAGLVRPTKIKDEDHSESTTSNTKPSPFLNKVKGLQSLNIELSWV